MVVGRVDGFTGSVADLQLHAQIRGQAADGVKLPVVLGEIVPGYQRLKDQATSQVVGSGTLRLDRTGLSPAELLNCHRIFNVPVSAAGCAALTEEDKAIMGKKKATAVVTPCANAKQGLPLAPIASTVKVGINVALGTDGAMEAGNLDLFEVMRQTAYGERMAQNDPAKLPAAAVLMMATVCGARAQGRAEETGMLKEGLDADIVLVDFTAPHLMPCHNVLSSLVFSAKGGDVALTMVRGKILYQSGRFPTIDLAKVVEEITGYAIPKLLEESK